MMLLHFCDFLARDDFMDHDDVPLQGYESFGSFLQKNFNFFRKEIFPAEKMQTKWDKSDSCHKKLLTHACDSIYAMEYHLLLSQIQDLRSSCKKKQREETFIRILKAIFNYCCSNGNQNMKRCQECGIVWLPNNLYAINGKIFSRLICNSRSYTNKNFTALGFILEKKRADTYKELQTRLPRCGERELRHWSIRICISTSINAEFHKKLYPEIYSEIDI